MTARRPGLRWGTALACALTLTAGPASAQPSAEDARKALADGERLWRLKRTRSALEALLKAARHQELAAEAYLRIGRIYFFKGWEAEGAFPGWHEEVEYRERAFEAFRNAAAARPDWDEPWLAIGDSLLRSQRVAEALAAFDAALARNPRAQAPRLGRWKALKALGRIDAVEKEVEAAAATTFRFAHTFDVSDTDSVGTARQGYEMLGRQRDADALAQRLLEAFPGSVATAALRAERIEAARRAKKYASVIEEAERFLETARSFGERFPASERLPAVYDALIEGYQATPATPVETLAAAIDARIAARPDPGAYLAGANLLLSRGALDQARKLAEDLVPAAETFIDENRGSYKLADKARGSLNRARATSADLVGWALFKKGDVAAAEARLLGAERLSRGQDFANQLHVAELLRKKGATKEARQAYLNALSLASGALAQRAAARRSLAELQASEGQDPAGFEAWLEADLERRREARRAELLRSMVDRAVPPLPLVSLPGEPIDVSKLRGKLLLYKFFASW